MKTLVVRPKTIDDVLVNPGMGFTTFQRFNGDALNEGRTWTEGFPLAYQEYKGSLENIDHPMTSIAYFRIYWKFIEPEKGRYSWDVIDKALETAKSRKQSLMLRIAPHGLFDDDDDVPDWYRQIVGERTEWPEKKWRVNPEDPRYLQHFGGLIRELGKRYDGHPDLESIDGALIGAWGEGEGTDLLADVTMKALVDAYVDNFKKTPILTMLYDGESNRYALSKANVGYRGDCLGDSRDGAPCFGDFKDFDSGSWSHMLDLYPRQIICSGMQDAWMKAPVSFEVCWVVSHWLDMGWDIDYIIAQSLKWHISTFNAKSSPIPAVWKDKVDRWLKRMGYRLALRRFTYPETVEAGGSMEYSCWIENSGVAPCYKPFRFALRLMNEKDARVFTTDADILKWLPGDSVHDGSLVIPADMPEGIYEMQAGIIDGAAMEPRVKLAMEGLQQDGWYSLGNIRVLRKLPDAGN